MTQAEAAQLLEALEKDEGAIKARIDRMQSKKDRRRRREAKDW